MKNSRIILFAFLTIIPLILLPSIANAGHPGASIEMAVIRGTEIGDTSLSATNVWNGTASGNGVLTLVDLSLVNSTVISVNQITTAGLSGFDVLVMPGEGADRTNWVTTARQDAIKNWVQGGGVLIIANSLGTNFSGFNGTDPLMGSFPATYNLEWGPNPAPASSGDSQLHSDPTITFPDTSHPLVNNPNTISPSELTGWNQSYHNHIVGSSLGSSWTVVIQGGSPTNNPVGAVAGFGSGGVIVLPQHFLHFTQVGADKLAENSILHTNIFADTTPPDPPTIDTLNGQTIVDASALTNDSTPLFNGTAEQDSTVVLFSSVDGAIGEDVANSPWGITSNQTLSEGSHTITANATDAAGNTSTDTSITLTVDTIPPAAPAALDLDDNSDSGSSDFDNITSDNTPRINGTAESGAFIRLNANGTQVGTGTAMSPWSIVSSALSDGFYEMTANATDAAGNGSPESSILGITIDTTIGTPTIQAIADTLLNVAELATATVDVDVSTDFQGADEVTLKFGGQTVGTLQVSDASGGILTFDISGLNDGTAQFIADAIDVAGNTSQDTSAETVTIDTVANAPTNLDVDSKSDSGSSNTDDNTSDETPNITGDTDEAGTVRIYSDINDLVAEFAVASMFNETVNTLNEDTHSITANFTDTAGNNSTLSSLLQVIIDKIAPTTTVTTSQVDDNVNPVPLAENAFTNSTQITIPFTAIDNGDSGVDFTECQRARDPNLNGASQVVEDAFTQCSPSPYFDNGLAEGNQTTSMRSTDFAGNLESTATFSWIVDFTDPTFTVPADVRTNATEGSPTNTTSIIPEIVVPAVTDNLDPNPTIIDPRNNFYNIGNTTLTWTAKDAAGNKFSQDQTVTVARVTIDSVEISGASGVADFTPLWDVEEQNMTGTVHGYFTGEKITVRWGDGLTTDVPVSSFTGGNANTGATWSAQHNYTAAFSSQALTANATLVSNPDVTISNNETITPAPHPTTLTIKTIVDVDTTDAVNPSVPWGFNYTVGFNMTDSVFNAAIPTSLTLEGLPLDYTDSTANTTSTAVIGTVSDNADGTADVSEVFLALEGEDANIDLQSVNATFFTTAAFLGSSNGTDLTISPHHTNMTIDDIEDVDVTDGLDPSVFWGYDFLFTYTFDDLNATDAESLAGNNRLNETQTINHISSDAINTSFTTANQTSGNDASSEILITKLTAKGSGSTGSRTVNATFAAIATYIGSTAQQNTTITPHHTTLVIGDLENVDTTGGLDDAVFWDWFFDSTFTFSDDNSTDARILVGNNRLNETLTINYTASDSLGPTSQLIFTTSGNDAESVTNTNELTANTDGNVSAVNALTVNATFAGTDNYVKSSDIEDMTITQHHTGITILDIPDVTENIPISGAGVVTDLNVTTSLAPNFITKGATSSETVEGKTVKFLGDGAVNLADDTTEGITISNATVIDCSTCLNPNDHVMKIGFNETIDLPVGTKQVNLHIQNTTIATNFIFNVTTGTGTVYPDGPFIGTLTPDVNLVQIIGSNALGGISQIKIINITDGVEGPEITNSSAVIGISFIEITNATSNPVILLQANFSQVLDTGIHNTTFTLLEGFYYSTGNSTSGENLKVQANFTGDANYINSTTPDPFYSTTAATTTQAGIGGTVSIAPDSGVGISAIICGIDVDKDSLCKRWENQHGVIYIAKSTTLLYDLPTPINPETGTGILSDRFKKDVYVEIDYLPGQRPSGTAINDTVTSFFNSGVDGGTGIRLHVVIDEEIPDFVRNVNVWRDADDDDTNDFNSIKAQFFGTSEERNDVDLGVSASFLTSATSMSYGGLLMSSADVHPVNEPSEGDITAVFKITFDADPGTLTVTSTGQSGEDRTQISIAGSSVSAIFTDTAVATEKLLTTEQHWVSRGDQVFTNQNIGTMSVGWTSSTGASATAIDGFGDPKIKSKLLDAKAQVTHYVLFAHNIGTGCGGPSGVAETPGNDVVIGLGCNWGQDSGNLPSVALQALETGGTFTTGSEEEQAGTFMHELGHNLGLLHGGPQKQISTGFLTTNAGVNCKPNYYSVMNYALQTPVFNAFHLDYSQGNFTNSPLVETALNETKGLTGNLGETPILVFGTPGGSTLVNNTFTGGPNIDWNNDDTIAAVGVTVSADINDLGMTGCESSPGQTLIDNEDWSNLVYSFRTVNGGSFDGPSPLDEQTSVIVRTAEEDADWYDGLIRHHTLLPNPGNEVEFGGVSYIQFQYLSCGPNPPVDEDAADTCKDENKIVKQLGFYLTNSQESEAGVGEETLSFLSGRTISAEIFDTDGNLVATIDEFHELVGTKGLYFYPWDTDLGSEAVPGPGTYFVTISDVTSSPFPLVDKNSGSDFKVNRPNSGAEDSRTSFEVEVLPAS